MIERRTASGNTAYFEAGSGEPLVLVHGFPLSKAMWHPQLRGLAEAARVLAPDLPGFGGSTVLDGTASMDAMADRIASFLHELRLDEPLVLGGLSMGGYVALAFARRHGQRLRGLILADTRAEADDETGRANRDKMIALTKSFGPHAVIELMLPNLFGTDTIANQPKIADEVRAMASIQPSAGVIDALKALRDRPDATPKLGAIAVPTLVIVGEQDAITPVARAEVLVRGIPGARLVVVPRAGHLANLEQPAEFNKVVQAFLRKLARA